MITLEETGFVFTLANSWITCSSCLHSFPKPITHTDESFRLVDFKNFAHLFSISSNEILVSILKTKTIMSALEIQMDCKEDISSEPDVSFKLKVCLNTRLPQLHNERLDKNPNLHGEFLYRIRFHVFEMLG